MATYYKRALLANTFGTFGYLSCLLLWMWVVIHYLPMLFDNQQFKELMLPSGGRVVLSPPPVESSPAIIVFALVVTVILVAVSLFILLRAPVTIAKTGKTMTTKAADSIVPLVVHGRTLPPEEKRRLTASLIKLIKLLLVFLPVIAGLLTAFVPITLPYEVVMLVSSLLAGVSFFWFSAQYICAAALGVKPESLV